MSTVLARADVSTTRFEKLIQDRVANKTFMGSVLVAKGDEVIFDKSYGSANLEWDVPNTPDTKFRVGSVTKQFTAASILLLQEHGKLSIDDPVKKYFTDAPPAWDKITLFHLLTHTSGIPSYTDVPNVMELVAQPTTPRKLIDSFKSKSLLFEPGTKWKYSNSGYIVLGYIIEKVSGVTYQRFLDENIFKPLGMKDSGYDSNTQIIKCRASGYESRGGTFQNAPYIDMSETYSAGSIYSTTHDLLRWERALFGAKLLSQASLQKMTTPFKDEYGFGLFIRNLNGRREIEHGGDINGFNTDMAFWPDDQLTVIALGNVNGFAPDGIVRDLSASAHGEQVTAASERKEITLAPDALKPYVGRYDTDQAPGMHLDITLEKVHLEAQLSGQPKFPIFAESPTRFFWKVVDAQIDFAKDASGKVTGGTLHQAGRDLPWKKTSDEIPAVQHKEITLTPEQMSALARAYQVAAGTEMNITVDNGHLYGQITGQPKFELFAESPTHLFLKVVDAQMDFDLDASGKATKFTLHQGGRDSVWTRE